ncbi:MAG: AAC(3) family N-acetyltransferase [Ardenticatenales bacterium]|nr:AAC(3) family N-acetyltransferase [Ardenticatenales bacterium]
MSEQKIVERSAYPITRRSLGADLAALGVRTGMTLLVHSSLSALGWVVGGPGTVVLALLDSVGGSGTLVMPSFAGDNSEPSHWQSPPVPEGWWPIVRAEMPAFDPATTPTRGMGRIAESFRTYPGTVRGPHPQNAFAAYGPAAAQIVAPHPLANSLGEGSPLSRLYERGAYVLLLGVGHGNNTSLHLAEDRADFPRKATMTQGSAMRVDGERRWVTWEELDWRDDDFPLLGAAFEQRHAVSVGAAGHGTARLMAMRDLVDFGIVWLSENRR